MAKYHISPDGLPRQCNPEKTGVCRYGATEPHFDTVEEASLAAEAKLAEEYSPLAKKKKLKSSDSPLVKSFSSAKDANAWAASVNTVGDVDVRKLPTGGWEATVIPAPVGKVTSGFFELWNNKAKALASEDSKLKRQNAGIQNPEEWAAADAKRELKLRDALAENHGVTGSSVQAANGSYLVKDAEGVNRVYGVKGKEALAYLGALHPKLKTPVSLSGESKPMTGDRESTPQEIASGRGVKFYSYATVTLADGKEYIVTLDDEKRPTQKKVWDFIGNNGATALPEETFKDVSLMDAIRHGGVIARS